jgi:hypothetical protein
MGLKGGGSSAVGHCDISTAAAAGRSTHETESSGGSRGRV